MVDYVPQAQLARLTRLVAPNRVVVVYGPRQIGKTTMIRRYVRESDPDALLVSGEDITVRDFLASQSITKLRAFVGNRRTLVIDEAQHVPQIGFNLKLLVDHVEGLQIVATGSSSFELAQQTGEPLTGRKVTLLLLPLAQLELNAIETAHETSAQLETRLIYGAYPEVVLAAGAEDREMYLKELVSAYLFKDILALEGIRHPDKLLRLLQLLAFQIGRETSVSELGNQLGLGKNTIQRYLDLLEKTFVVFNRMGFSRNLRKEIVKSRHYYFYDNGVRNAVISNFSPLALRDDVGALWENYIQVERLKHNLYTGRLADSYFWRTYDQQEVDLVEEHAGRLHGIQIKWSTKSHARAPRAWTKGYPESAFSVVHPGNYLDYIAPPAPPLDAGGTSPSPTG